MPQFPHASSATSKPTGSILQKALGGTVSGWNGGKELRHIGTYSQKNPINILTFDGPRHASTITLNSKPFQWASLQHECIIKHQASFQPSYPAKASLAGCLYGHLLEHTIMD